MTIYEWGYRFEALLPDALTPNRALGFIVLAGYLLYFW